ncbi:hypothetical protein IW146_009969, partial [Coemansia sp. RSA 922]
LRLSSLAMTDRHRRTSAFPRPNVDRDRTLTAATMAAHRDDDDLDAFADWQCRVYLLLDTLAERDRWLNELTSVAVPSAENARKRMQQRRIAAAAELASNTESLRQSGKHVAVKALEKMSMAQTAYAKKVFVDSASGHRVISLSSAQVPDIDATLTENVAVRKPVAMAFGKPATFSLTISPDVAHPPPPAKKRLRARRRSNSVADMRNTHKPSDDESFKPLRRKGSGASTVLEVVGKAMERRPGTVSRRFLFVWNINEI